MTDELYLLLQKAYISGARMMINALNGHDKSPPESSFTCAWDDYISCKAYKYIRDEETK